VCYDRIEPAFQRYVAHPVPSRHEIWLLRHPLRHIPRGKILRIIVEAQATVIWTADNWATKTAAHTSFSAPLRLWHTDIPTEKLASGAAVEFTFFWTAAQRWEGRNWEAKID
jgi:glucoamylase